MGRQIKKKKWKVFQQMKHYQKRGKQILRKGESGETSLIEDRKVKEKMRWMESKNGQVIWARLAREKGGNKERRESVYEMEITEERKGKREREHAKGKEQKKKMGEGLWPHFSSF